MYRDTVLKVALRAFRSQEMSERSPDGVSRQRLLREVQSSSEKFPVPWTTMSWLRFARLRCCSPLRKSSCDFRRCHAQMPGYELSQLASRVTSAMHAESSNGDDPFAKVKSLVNEMRWSRGWKRRRPRSLPTRRIVTEMLDAVESELPRHVEETEVQVSFSVIDARRQSSSSQRTWTAAAWCERSPTWMGRSQDEMGTLMTRLQGVENSLA